MSQIATKFLADNSVTELKSRLSNAAYLRARNAANSADVNILRVNSSNVIEFPSVPQIASGTPSAAADIANVSYVSTQIAQLPMKAPVAVIATSNLTLSGEQTIDGVLTSASRVLVAGQTTASANGIYVTGSGAWTRATDFNSSATVYGGVNVYVTQGTTNADTLWELTTDGAITVGTTSLAFARTGVTSVPTWNQQAITLSGTDITNQYVDLAQSIKASSEQMFVNGVMQRPTSDYTVSLTGGSGGVTRISFAGDLATGGGAALVSGDVLYFQYQY